MAQELASESEDAASALEPALREPESVSVSVWASPGAVLALVREWVPQDTEWESESVLPGAASPWVRAWDKVSRSPALPSEEVSRSEVLDFSGLRRDCPDRLRPP